MTSVGGYLELELNKGKEYHPEAIRLNTGRNALEYILRARKFQKIYLPFYTCQVLLQPLSKLGVEYEYYSIDESFEPKFDFTRLKKGESFLYTNYYGLKGKYIEKISSSVSGLIIDNAQSFYSKPQPGVDTFYSARKFFGVPDGAYLYIDETLEEQFEQDLSYERCAHLLIRTDLSAEAGYPFYQKNDESLDNNPIRQMSRLTQGLLEAIDYEYAFQIRRKNFDYLHSVLKQHNLLSLTAENEAVPLAYPFLSRSEKLRAKLISKRVYIARYWPEVASLVHVASVENRFVQNLLPLPIDQRLNKEDLDYIINLIQKHEHQG